MLFRSLSASRGMRAGVCLLPGPNAAYAAAGSDAEARGLVPRALVLPIWPGDSSYSSIYEYHAMRAGLRMLNGYAAVTEPAYVERVFRRFETMTEGDFTDDQFAALLKTGVTHVILHEDAFPAKVSLFPFGATLRRHLANPRLRLLARADGAWTFAVVDNPSSHSSLVTRHSSLEPPTRHWGVRPPQANAATKVRSFAEIHREGYGWLVRAEAGKDLALVSSFTDADGSLHSSTNLFRASREAGSAPGAPAPDWRLAFLPALDPSSNLWTHLSTPGDARISYVAYARDPALGGLPAPDSDGALRLPAIDLYHEFGSTTLARIPDEKTGGFVPAPDDLAFAPGPHPPCTAVEGPWLPLALPAGRYRATILEEKPDIAAAILSDQLGSPSPSPAAPSPFRLAGADGVDGLSISADGATADFAYDGTSPVSFRVSYDASRPGVLSAIAVAPARP